MNFRFVRQAVQFLKSEDGPSAVEYAILLALGFVICLGAITLMYQLQ